MKIQNEIINLYAFACIFCDVDIFKFFFLYILNFI